LPAFPKKNTKAIDIDAQMCYNGKNANKNKTGRRKKLFMEAVKQTIDSKLLSGVISLPKNFQNKKVEIIVFLNENEITMPKLAMSEINKMLKGSVTESLIGSVPQSGMVLEDYRAERLKKYDRAD
jgi:hypothetical protein